jgi:transcription elongation factor GreA
MKGKIMATNKINEMTREGYDNLNAELEHLITVVRKENAARLKEAISLGDISENAEYDAAKDAQAETEERISTIEEILRTAVIVEETDESDDSYRQAVQSLSKISTQRRSAPIRS